MKLSARIIMRAMMIIQVGFNRCGSESLHQFFVANGVSSVHWDSGQLAVQVMDALLRRAPPFLTYPDTDAFFDMERLDDNVLIEAFKFFPALYRAYPDAVFLLNTRSRSSWIESRLNHAGGHYARMYRSVLGLTESDLLTHWESDWDRHHERVRTFFASKGRLIEFNIHRDR